MLFSDLDDQLSGFLGDTWISILSAVNLSAVVNVVTGFRWSVWYGLQLLAVLASSLYLLRYSRSKINTLSQIVAEVSLVERNSERTLTLEEVIRIRRRYEGDAAKLRLRRYLVVGAAIAAVVFVIGANFVVSRLEAREKRELRSTLDRITRDIGAIASQLDSVLVVSPQQSADTSNHTAVGP